MKKKVSKKGVVQRTQTSIEIGNKLSLAFRNLLFFVGLSVLFSGLYFYSEEEFYVNLFFLLAVISGSVGVGFLIVSLALFFFKKLKK